MTRPPSPLTMLLSRHTNRRDFITLFGGVVHDDSVLTAKMLDYNEGTANFAFVEPEREYGPAPFGRHSACTIC
jgi:hypothetical protein